jgi:hypothetical protein
VIDPVSGSIESKGKVIYGISVNSVVELEEDAEAGMRKNHMCRFGKRVIE